MYRYGYAPDWHFIMPPFAPRPRRRRHRDDEYMDPMAQIEYWENAIKQLKDKLKDKKDDKKPSGWEQLQIFIGQISVMIVIGYPMGALFIKFVEGLYK